MARLGVTRTGIDASGAVVVVKLGGAHWPFNQPNPDPEPVTCSHPELQEMVEQHAHSGWIGSSGEGRAAVVAREVRDHISSCSVCLAVVKAQSGSA